MPETKTDKVKNIYAALLEVQRELPSLQKSAVNPHFKNKYVPLEELNPATLEVLNKHNLVWLTFPGVHDNEPALTYSLVYTPTGEQIGGTMLLQSKASGPQDQGSAITYGRRYALMAVLGLVADTDDDGEKAQAATVAPVSEQNKQGILLLLNKLGRTQPDFEKQAGKPLADLTNTEALMWGGKLRTELLSAQANH